MTQETSQPDATADQEQSHCSGSLGKPMRLIIAGGRDYRITDEGYEAMEAIGREFNVVEVVCGGASGADETGRCWAISRNTPVKMFPADWKKHGKAAGLIRNREMAEYADALLLFPGGRGTDSMFRCAEANGLLIFDLRSSAPA